METVETGESIYLPTEIVCGRTGAAATLGFPVLTFIRYIYIQTHLCEIKINSFVDN